MTSPGIVPPDDVNPSVAPRPKPIPVNPPKPLCGAGLLSARRGDRTAHGGVITSGSAKVVVGGKPAARVTDTHTCPMSNPSPVAHVGGPVVSGSTTVRINFQPAARVTVRCTCTGATDIIAQGEVKVFVG